MGPLELWRTLSARTTQSGQTTSSTSTSQIVLLSISPTSACHHTLNHGTNAIQRQLPQQFACNISMSEFSRITLKTHPCFFCFSTCQCQQKHHFAERGVALSLGALWGCLGQQPFTNFKDLKLAFMTRTCSVT